MFGEIVGWCHESKKLIVQCYNKSGDKDGKPLAENWVDLWEFPDPDTVVVVNDESYNLRAYMTAANSVELAKVGIFVPSSTTLLVQQVLSGARAWARAPR
jgi:hypothetical protein